MIAHTSETSATIESTAPVQSIGCACGLRDVGTRKRPAMIAPITIGTFTMNTEPHQKCSSRNPPATGPSAIATPATPDQRPIATRSLARVGEHVREDRQRGGHDQRGADAHHRASSDERADVGGERGRRRRQAEDHQPGGERTLATEAVTERPRGEQEAGEHERVRIDDPLELAHAGAQVADEGGQGDVDDRVVDDDHEEAHAEHRERPPTVALGTQLAVALGTRRLGSALTAISREPGRNVVDALMRSLPERDTLVMTSLLIT